MLTQTTANSVSIPTAPFTAAMRADYLLVCEAKSNSLASGSWRFALESSDGASELTAGDEEAGDLNRLTLLAAVRGLEAIDGPSSVTLLSNNRYLIRSLSESLPRWRENGFVWEHFGRRIEVQHADMWRRIDRALSIHRVEACLISSRLVSSGIGGLGSQSEGRLLRIDAPHAPAPAPKHASRPRDELRRWLLSGQAGGDNRGSRRRFTADDLLEAS